MIFGTKRRVYVDDPSDAPPGVQLVTGPFGGIYWENNAPAGRVTRGGIEGEGGPAKPGGGPAKPAGGGGSAKKPTGGGGAKKPEKRPTGQPFKDANDASLPERVKKEPPERRDLFVRTFNAILEAGGGEIDAARLATEKLAAPAKQQAEAKRQAAQQKRQAEQERRRQQQTQRQQAARKAEPVFDLGEVRTAMNQLPDEFLSDAGRLAKAAAVAAIEEAEKAPEPKKTEGGRQFAAGDYADVPDPTKPSTWKLRLVARPGTPDAGVIADAITAMQPGGFRGNVVVLGSPKEKVVARINAAIGKLDDDALKKNLRTRLGKVKSLDDELCPHGYAFDEKCGECAPAMPMQMFGGATSFDEFDAFVASRELSQEVNELSYTFRGIVENVMGSMMMDPKEKAASVAKAASDFHSRIVALPEGETKDALMDESIEAFEIAGRHISAAAKEGKRVGKQQVGMLKRMFEDLKSLLGWASYEDVAPPEEGRKVLLSDHGGLQIYEKDGVVRWLTYSSNAFEDIEGELFSTKSLEDAVAWADAVGERGPLRIFHVPGADVGHCDYQAVFGRFLVESGTFADTPIGRKAKEYFLQNRDKRFGVSIGYLYRQGDELDRTYDWLRIRERSVTPEGMAANPWTEFTLGGDVMTDARKAAFLEDIFGKEAATNIISEAERRTKDLEPLVRHKAADVATAAAAAGSAVAVADPPPAGEGEQPPEGEDEQTKEIRTALAGLKDLVTSLAGIPDAISTLQKEVADLKKSDDEKIAAQLAPRARVGAEAASAKTGNVVGEELVKVVTGGDKDTPGASPVSVYVQDLLRQNGAPVAS